MNSRPCTTSSREPLAQLIPHRGCADQGEARPPATYRADGAEETVQRGPATIRQRAAWSGRQLVTERWEAKSMPSGTTEVHTHEVRAIEPDGTLRLAVTTTTGLGSHTLVTFYRRAREGGLR